jgi:hypothetical protein
VGLRPSFTGSLLGLLLCAVLFAQTPQPPVTYLSRDAAKPVFDALGESLPTPSAWDEWIAAADAATRARVSQGDETSLVNWLLFGTSFTNEPRITSRQLDAHQIADAIAARLNDFERAFDTATRRDDERFVFARRVLGDRTQVRPRLLSFLKRAIAENETYARLIRDAEALADPSLQFAERSRLYRARGL